MNKTTLEAWLEWREQCALASCGEATRRTLAEWASPQVTNKLRALAPHHELLNSTTPTHERQDVWRDDAWHLFESNMHATSSATGKRWKDWLFDKVAASTFISIVDGLEMEASCTISQAVRRFVAKEVNKPGVESLDALLAAGSDTRAQAEHLIQAEVDTTSPDNEAAERDLERIAEEEAHCFFSQLKDNQRRALAVRAAGLKLKNQKAQTFVGCGKSQLSAAQVDAARTFCQYLTQKWTSKDPSSVWEFQKRALPALLRLCLISLTPEERRTLGL